MPHIYSPIETESEAAKNGNDVETTYKIDILSAWMLLHAWTNATDASVRLYESASKTRGRYNVLADDMHLATSVPFYPYDGRFSACAEGRPIIEPV